MTTDPVMWQFRWTNPAANTDVTEADLAWSVVEPRSLFQSLDDRLAELKAFTYGDKPIYEVRALYAAAQPVNQHLLNALKSVQSVASASEGIAGWHRNGDLAGWDELLPEIDESIAQAEAQQAQPVHDPEYLDGVNVSRLSDALSWLGYATDGMESMAARLPDYVNYLTSAVLEHKEAFRAKSAVAQPVSQQMLEALRKIVSMDDAERLTQGDIERGRAAIAQAEAQQAQPVRELPTDAVIKEKARLSIQEGGPWRGEWSQGTEEVVQLAEYFYGRGWRAGEKFHGISAYAGGCQVAEESPPISPEPPDNRLKVKLGSQYGRDISGHWFYLQPADEFAEAALCKHCGFTPAKENQPPETETCRWTCVAAGAGRVVYRTKCNSEMHFDDGVLPSDGDQFYCHHCGKKIEIELAKEGGVA